MTLEKLLADPFAFVFVQGLLYGLAGACLAFDLGKRLISRLGFRGPASLSIVVQRGAQSMTAFYGVFAFVVGVYLSLDLNGDAAEPYRVAWVTLDLAACCYLFLWNHWTRNIVAGFAGRLPNIERR